ncbi:MAG: hypothetical protein HY563_07400 [Ignavibacteriales bacterium]|nr:hypothetical protein [Ignavibacteriales bacterium]
MTRLRRGSSPQGEMTAGSSDWVKGRSGRRVSAGPGEDLKKSGTHEWDAAGESDSENRWQDDGGESG